MRGGFDMRLVLAMFLNFIVVGSGLFLYGKYLVGVFYLLVFVAVGFFRNEAGFVWSLLVVVFSYVHLVLVARKANERSPKWLFSLWDWLGEKSRVVVVIIVVLLLFLLLFYTGKERSLLREDVSRVLFSESVVGVGGVFRDKDYNTGPIMAPR